jgi:hypothetical protein
MKLRLKRTYTDNGTFGKLYCDGDFICYTVERTWKNNEASVSCIPEGEYQITPHVSPKFGSCYIVEQPTLGVTKFGPSQRTHILFHPANHAGQLQGCIAPGSAFGVVESNWAVTGRGTEGRKYDALC